MTQKMTNKNEWLTENPNAVTLGKVKITIYKSAALACISGGDAGPGTATDPGLNYSWNLPISNIYTGSKEAVKMVTQTLDSCMAVIAGNAMLSCQSYPAVSSGSYDGDAVQIGCNQPYGSDSSSFPTAAQLQLRGEGIDLSSVNDPNYANLSLLPKGIFIAQPASGVTTRILGIIIED